MREEGSSFQRTLDALRNSLAHHYLRNSSLSGTEISFLLGFENPNSFVRAFQAWSGIDAAGGSIGALEGGSESADAR